MMKTVGLAAVMALAVALALGLYRTATTAAAGDRLETQVRGKVSCPTKLRALQISAFASNPSIGAADMSITTGEPSSADGLFGMSSQQPRYGLSSTCHTVSRRVALTHRGLTSAGVVHAGDVRWPTAYCPVTRRVLLRFVIALDASGKPVSATIAARTQPRARGGKPKSKPIGFVQWSRTRAVTYYSSACTSQEQ